VEYAAEDIEWSSVSFVDNQECLDLIAKKPTGLLPLLDEECRCVYVCMCVWGHGGLVAIEAAVLFHVCVCSYSNGSHLCSVDHRRRRGRGDGH